MTDSSTSASGLDQIAKLLDSLSADQLELPTPCDDWTVAELAAHVVGTAEQFTVMARGGQPDWAAPAPQTDQPGQALRQHAAELISAVDGGDGSFPSAMAAGEFAVHAWDLATALGHDTGEFDPSVAEAGYGFMTASLTDEMRGQAFAAEQPAPPNANAYERLAAFAGRSISPAS